MIIENISGKKSVDWEDNTLKPCVAYVCYDINDFVYFSRYEHNRVNHQARLFARDI